jgi:hypothetical protein
MSARLAPIGILLALLLVSMAAAGEPATAPAATPPPALGVPAPAAAPLGDGGPSLLGALARLIGAVLVLAAIMAGCVLGYRKLVDRAGNKTGVLAWATGWAEEASADSVRVSSRRYLGGRESVAVIHAGGERFLVGITAANVSLISRLEPPDAEPVRDFTDALTQAAAPRPAERETAADTLRAAVERSRERLGRLASTNPLAGIVREPRA